MDALRLKPRQPVEADMENWDDDDDFMIEGDDITFRSNSTNAQAASSRRDSHSSFRSDLESLAAEDERQVHLPGDDEKSTLNAIAIAANAGIPIPKNVPPSALTGGTIKRLGGRKIKTIFQEDWADDLELPETSQPLKIKARTSTVFPETLQHDNLDMASNDAGPAKAQITAPIIIQQKLSVNPTKTPSRIVDLDRFRDDDDDDDFFGDGSTTIKITKKSNPISLITPPTPRKTQGEDDFEQDLELPSDGKLKLSKRKDIPKTPNPNSLDDFEWGEGSLGTRFGGTRRDGRSTRSSNASVMSPSVSSSFTAESEVEDEALDGLVLPTGPLNFEERLRKRRQSRSPSRPPVAQPKASVPQQFQSPPASKSEKEDFFSGLDLGDDDVFTPGKLTLHRNIKVKETRPASPSRPKTAVSLTFTNKLVGTVSRLPRPSHERTHTASSLEPVSESGGPIVKASRRSQSRMGHSAQSSVSSIPTPSTPSSTQSSNPSTPLRRDLGQRMSHTSLRIEPTTTAAQLLRYKRSLPVMKQPQSPARPVTSRGYDRPPSRSEIYQRPQSSLRPKTPVERLRPAFESAAAQARKPFLPAGASQSQSQHVSVKNSTRTFRRYDSDNISDFRPSSRAMSRSTIRSPSPVKKYRLNIERNGQESAWQQLQKPRRLRHFGDGHELDAFDDLPTSSQAEAKFTRQPAGYSKSGLRNKIYQNVLPGGRTTTPSPAPQSPVKADYVPSFARDTASSRLAREACLAQRGPSGPLAPLTAQRVAQLSMRNTSSVTHLPRSTVRPKKSRKTPQLKPHLISNLGSAKESKTLNGMFYNPATMRWEGNENALSAFEVPASPSTTSIPPHAMREKENTTPRPALITPIGATKGVQVVGGMVFDPQNMCWLKLGPQGQAQSDTGDTLDGFNGIDSDEDVFRDIPDLDDGAGDSKAAGSGRISDIKDDWLVGEEFDVGPEFIRRHREEEERWKRKCGKWAPREEDEATRTAWRWALRDLVMSTMAAN